MKKRKKKYRGVQKEGGKNSKGGFFNKPFKKIKLRTAADESEEKPAAAPRPSPAEKKLPDDDAAYRNAMRDVAPLAGGQQLARRQVKPKPFPRQQDDESLVMRELDDLVQGEVPFDFADTDEYVEASTSGLDHQVVKKLKRGDYSYQAHLDLHGLNREQARAHVAEFVHTSQRDGKRCVLIVHGRGLGSKDNIPVLKNKLAAWLTRGSIGRRVLAFTSAKPYDGGTGAIYVLLRRR